MSNDLQVSQRGKQSARDFFGSWPRVPIPTYFEAALAEHISRFERDLLAEREVLRGALRAVEPYLDAIICYASSRDEHDGNRVAALVSAALKDNQP